MSRTAQSRPSVLAGRDGVETPAQAIANLLATRAAFDQRILALLGDGRERYSVEVAEAMGLGLRGYARAGNRLRQLEAGGALVSRFVEGKDCGGRSGLGRRYFRIVSARAGR